MSHLFLSWVTYTLQLKMSTLIFSHLLRDSDQIVLIVISSHMWSHIFFTSFLNDIVGLKSNDYI